MKCCRVYFTGWGCRGPADRADLALVSSYLVEASLGAKLPYDLASSFCAMSSYIDRVSHHEAFDRYCFSQSTLRIGSQMC